MQNVKVGRNNYLPLPIIIPAEDNNSNNNSNTKGRKSTKRKRRREESEDDEDYVEPEFDTSNIISDKGRIATLRSCKKKQKQKQYKNKENPTTYSATCSFPLCRNKFPHRSRHAASLGIISSDTCQSCGKDISKKHLYDHSCCTTTITAKESDQSRPQNNQLQSNNSINNHNNNNKEEPLKATSEYQVTNIL